MALASLGVFDFRLELKLLLFCITRSNACLRFGPFAKHHKYCLTGWAAGWMDECTYMYVFVYVFTVFQSRRSTAKKKKKRAGPIKIVLVAINGFVFHLNRRH